MGEYNCASLICCPPGEESQRAIVSILVEHGCDPDAAKVCAPHIQKAFDLMPPGSMASLKGAIVQMYVATKRTDHTP
jgi:hypothetical protein